MLRGHWKHTLKGSLRVSSRGPYGFRIRVSLRASIQIFQILRALKFRKGT